MLCRRRHRLSSVRSSSVVELGRFAQRFNALPVVGETTTKATLNFITVDSNYASTNIILGWIETRERREQRARESLSFATDYEPTSTRTRHYTLLVFY